MINSSPSENSNLNGKRSPGFKKILQGLGPVAGLDKAPDLILESFPRSGNTFMHIALRLSWPDMIIKSHSHDPMDIENAEKDTPIASMVRKPEDTIVSWTVFANAKENLSHFKDIENSIRAYRQFITAVIENNNVFVIPFQDAVENVNEVLDRLASRYGLPPRVYNSNEDILKHTRSIISPYYKGADDFAKTGHTPRDLDPLYENVKNSLKDYDSDISSLNNLFEIAIAKYR